MLSAGQRDRASSAKRLWAGKVAWSCSVSPALVGWDGEQRGRALPASAGQCGRARWAIDRAGQCGRARWAIVQVIVQADDRARWAVMQVIVQGG